MKVKTIKKVLNEKFEDFCKSIDDPQVKRLVQQNTIITGGCIASMLLREPVNDFDLYFTNKETVKAVAEYYCKKFVAANPTKYELTVCEKKATDEVNKERVYIKCKSKGIAQSDDYEDTVAKTDESEESAEYSALPEEEMVKKALDIVKKDIDTSDRPKYRPIFLSSNAITLSNKIQIVIRFYGNPKEIHENYDFVHAMNYWLSATNELVTHTEALEALLAKNLVYKGSKYPIASILRAKKFILRGWSINAGQYLKMAFQISKLNMEDLEVLHEQLTGCDMAYMGAAVSALRDAKQKNPDLQFDQTYFAEIIDRIFGV